MDLKGKSLPNSLEAERKVLGSCLRDAEALVKALDLLKPEMFFSPRHQQIFFEMNSLMVQTKPVDLMMLSDALEKRGELEKVGGPSYLMELANSVATAVNVAYHAQIVREKHQRRWLIRACSEVSKDAFESPDEAEEILSRARVRFLEVDDRRDGGRFLHESCDDLIEWLQKMNERQLSGERFLGDIQSGFCAMDDITGGFDLQELIVIAASPSVGKTALAQGIAEFNAVQKGNMTAVVSIEMGQFKTEQRQIFSMAKSSIADVRRGRINREQTGRIMRACTDIQKKKYPLFITGYVTGLDQIVSLAQRLKLQSGLKLLIIDYFQLIQSEIKNGTKNDELEKISATLKYLTKKLNIVTIVLSQFSKEGVKELETGNPQPDRLMNAIRGTGRLANDADTCIALWRGGEETEKEKPYFIEYEGNNVQVVDRHGIVFKQRNGELRRFSIPLALDYIRFLDRRDEMFDKLPF